MRSSQPETAAQPRKPASPDGPHGGSTLAPAESSPGSQPVWAHAPDPLDRLIHLDLAGTMEKLAAQKATEGDLERLGTASSDFKALAAALMSTPDLLWHPLVHEVIRHLRVVRSSRLLDEYLAQDAQTTLQQLLEAAAAGLLGGGAWSLRPPPKRPGRKAADDVWLLDDFETIRESLSKETLRKQSSESDPDWARRVANIVERLWAGSSLSDYLDETDPLHLKKFPLPASETVASWVQDAQQQKGEDGRAFRDVLCWKMLAHRHSLTEGQVRGRIAKQIKETKQVK